MAGVSFCNKRVRNWLKKVSKNVTVDQLSNAKDVANVGNPIINLPFGGMVYTTHEKIGDILGMV